MIELLVAYLLWEGDAPAEWWGLYVAVIILKLGLAWRRHQEIAWANAEADRVVKKLFEERAK
jgi:hypothetical protein